MRKIIRKISAVMLSGLTALTLCAGGFSLNAEGEQPISEQSMPEGFITSLKICKLIEEGSCTEFGEEEIERDSKLNLAFEYVMPKDILPEVTYTFNIEGNFTHVLPFTIYSDSITENNGIAARGDVEGNTVKLTFTQAASKAELLVKGTTGNFWFGASFDGEKIENSGYQEFKASAQGKSTTPKLNFAITPISANVDLTKVSAVDLENRIITWTIDVSPSITNAPNDKQKLNRLTVTDVIPDKLTYVEGKSSVSNGEKMSYVDGLVTVEFKELDVKTKPVITIVTSFDPTAEGFLTNNMAVFKNQVNAEYIYPQIKKDNDPDSSTYNQAIDAEPGTGKAEPAEATAEITGSLLDKTGSLLNGNTMTWTIKVKNALGLENPIIKDTLPTDTSIVMNTLKLGNQLITNNNQIIPYYELEGQNLTIYLEKNTSEQVITYETKFNEDWKDKEGEVVNTAKFYGGEEPGLLVEKSATVQLGDQLLTKTGTYDASDHTITWKIDVKNTGNRLTNIVLTDTIPDGQELVGSDDISNSVKAVGSSKVEYSSNNITITYNDNYNGWDNQSPDIEYKTILKDDQKKLWGNNTSGVNAENTIAISAIGLPSQNLSVTGNAPIVSKVLKKDYVNYSFTDKQVTWQLTINENQMALNNAKIVDTLPEGWKFVEDSVVITQGDKTITNFNKSFSNQDMNLELPTMNKGDEPYIITYKAQLIDEELLATNKEIIAENTSVLTGDEIVDGGVSVTGNHKIAQSVIEKKGDSTNFAKEGYLSWEILVNRNLSEINAQSGKNVIIIDELNEYLMPVMDSIKVYKLELEANGKEKGRTILKNDEYLINYEVSTKTLSIDFKKNKLTDAYIINFNTDVLESGKYTNSAHFDGMPIENMSASSQSINAQFSGGSTTTSYGKVEAVVKNDKDEPLNEVEFSIYKKDSKTPLYTGITINDLALLTLRSGKYTLMITKVPTGYLMPSNPSQEFEITKNGTSQLDFQLDKKPDSSDGGSSGGNTPKPVPPVEPVDPDKEVQIPSEEIVPEGDGIVNTDSEDNKDLTGNNTEIKDNASTHGIPNTSDPTGTYMLLALMSLGLLLVCIYIDNRLHLEH